MLTYLTAGESHGPQLTAVIDGLPAGLRLDVDQINFQLARRQKGYGRGGRMLIEKDRVQIVGGLRGGVAMGGPLALIIPNLDYGNWSGIMSPTEQISDDLTPKQKGLAYGNTCPRPGHADLPGAIKWNHRDMRNVLERASARETAARVALGAVARQLLERFGVDFASHVVRIGEAALPEGFVRPDNEAVRERSEASEVRCIDPDTEAAMVAAIRLAKKDKNSLGGIAEIVIGGLPIGLGGFGQDEHRLDGRLAGALMAIHSVKGVEIGMGFEAARSRGTDVHDEIFHDPNGRKASKGFYRRTNNAGGIEGGMTNGENVVARVAGKPISTLNRPLQTVDIETKKAAEAIVERTDVCVTPALAVVAEAAAALVLADAFLEKFGADNIVETERNYQSFLDSSF